MKKSALILALFSAFLFVSTLAFAEDSYGPPPPDDQGQNMQQSDDMQGGRQGMMGGGPGMMKGGMMRQPTMIATPDGGVIVLSGRTLTKYDANLEMVKEVELKQEKPKAPLPKPGDDMMMHARHESVPVPDNEPPLPDMSSRSDSAAAPAPAAASAPEPTQVPILTPDAPAKPSPEPSADIQSGSAQ